MRIALISFEFPPAVAIGGIGAYSLNAAHLLADGGHSVEIFAAGPVGKSELSSKFRVNRLDVSDRDAFRRGLVDLFLDRHRAAAFDLMESPEYGAEAANVHAAAPEITHVVRLHTPHFLTHELNRVPPTLRQRLRFMLGALRQCRFAWLKEDQRDLHERDALERENARAADLLIAPCHSIREIVCTRWKIAPENCTVVPNVFAPDDRLRSMPPPSMEKRITFLGRLEIRKGILELAAAIPEVLRRHPDASFAFVGPPSAVPYRKERSDVYLQHRLRKHLDHCKFVGAQDRSGVLTQLARTDVAVFPSRWENFPNVCLEAMSASRPVVGSSAGGMADIIEDQKSGILVPPLSSGAIARAIISLLDDPPRALSIGRAARQRVADYCSPSAVAPRQLAAYREAIGRSSRHSRQSLGTLPIP